jgi:mannose-6-phosphate isomerase-like protein (cupin superfamily)
MSNEVTKVADAPIYTDERYGHVHELAGEETGVPALGVGIAVVRPGAGSPDHRHLRMTEVYLITAGRGRMRLDQRAFDVSPGDCISIAPGRVHGIVALGDEPLVFTVITSPAYDLDDDFEVGEDEA